MMHAILFLLFNCGVLVSRKRSVCYEQINKQITEMNTENSDQAVGVGVVFCCSVRVVVAVGFIMLMKDDDAQDEQVQQC